MHAESMLPWRERVPPQNAAAAVVAPRCNYTSGSIEQEWLRKPAYRRICALAFSQLEPARSWTEYSARAWLGAGSGLPMPPPTDEQHGQLSRFVCEDGDEYIEPLSGVARLGQCYRVAVLERNADARRI